ncbi:hypothetical protein B0H13DRAFT_2261410 [Mycena leptocephala]|nr:hypothetical protein B0H13DRAFT_2261410 [Mycena leptocephala]
MQIHSLSKTVDRPSVFIRPARQSELRQHSASPVPHHSWHNYIGDSEKWKWDGMEACEFNEGYGYKVGEEVKGRTTSKLTAGFLRLRPGRHTENDLNRRSTSGERNEARRRRRRRRRAPEDLDDHAERAASSALPWERRTHLIHPAMPCNALSRHPSAEVLDVCQSAAYRRKNGGKSCTRTCLGALGIVLDYNFRRDWPG